MPDVPSPDGVQWLRPSPRMWSARLALVSVVAVPVLAALTIGLALGVDAPAAAVALAVGLVVTAVVLFMLRRRYTAWGYAERGDDLLVRRGVMLRRLSVVPYGRMQFIDVTAGPVDRIFGLATVQLHTAAAATDARIPGLQTDEAERLRDRLAALGEAQAAGL
ncbi:MAG: PH domain-containing protein [Frankiales bacterium]|nr:PH domain-containing protein [Frankiales bacterium]